MRDENQLDLESILAEFHAQEQVTPPRQPRPETAQVSRRPGELPKERPAPAPAPQTEAAGEHTALYVFRKEAQPLPAEKKETAPALRTPAPAGQSGAEPVQPPRRKREAPRPAAKPAEQPAADPEQKRLRAARRRAKGRLRVAAALLLFAAAMAGLLWLGLRDERERDSREPEPLRLNLVESMSDYLDEASVRSHG